MSDNTFKNYYKKSKEERINILNDLELFDNNLNIKASDLVFNNLIENYITTYEVGLGIAPNFLIDNKLYQVPMATEEPSVIAAASHASKIILANGGFKTISLENKMIGQVIFKDVLDQDDFKNYLESNFNNLFNVAKKAHPEIHKLGGGVNSFRVEIKELNFVTLYVTISTLDAMGANTINTILESIATYVTTNYSNAKVLMSILSNNALNSLVRVRVKIDPNTLKNGLEVIKDIELANTYASIDPYRAVTHNKGVMNGITALMLATGNDTRSVEAGIHAYASRSGSYKPLTKWFVENNFLIGEIEVPLPIGTVGGSMGVLPKVKLSHKILNTNKKEDLMKIAASLGLAQNFAALYALTTDGINKGHMRLQAKNIAIQAGANESNIDDCINYMIKEKTITLNKALEFLSKK